MTEKKKKNTENKYMQDGSLLRESGLSNLM